MIGGSADTIRFKQVRFPAYANENLFGCGSVFSCPPTCLKKPPSLKVLPKQPRIKLSNLRICDRLIWNRSANPIVPYKYGGISARGGGSQMSNRQLLV